MATDFKPMLAETGTEPFDDPKYIFEWKWNGIRVIAHKDGANSPVRLQGRNGMDYTAAFPEMADIGKLIKFDKAVIDGEIVCMDEQGLPVFNRVQNRFNQHDPTVTRRLATVYPATYMVFDVVHVEEFDLTAGSPDHMTLVQRKEVLQKILIPDHVMKESPFIDGKGKEMHALAVKLDQEGIMAKTKTGLYVPGGRNEDWLKLKIPKFRNFVVCGYTQGTGAREDQFGALVLGLPDKDGFRYMGSAGSGFTEAGVREMLGLLRFMRTDVSPMTPGTKVPQLLSWVNPGMVVMVKYYDITKDGKLIWPIFQKIQRGARIPDEVGFDFKVV